MLSECPNRDGGMETPPFLKLKPRLMDTKIKAEELYNKFYDLLFTSDFREVESKRAAILCVDEIIKEVERHEIAFEMNHSFKDDWEEVKEHLNNM